MEEVKQKSKIALVTGGMGGIGYATVLRLRRAGITVVGMGTRAPEHPAVIEKFTKLGIDYLQGNLAERESRERVLAEIVARYGRLDILVNVAGMAPRVRADLLEMTEESYDEVMSVNTKGTMFLSQSAAKIMLQNERDERGLRGFIVNIGSLSAYTSSTSRGEYCVSKAGVSMLTGLFADRLADEGILVNEVRPGIIETDMTATVKGKYDNLIYNEGILPIRRWGKPEDVAEAVYVLASGALGYTTGQAIDVDGGFHIRRL